MPTKKSDPLLTTSEVAEQLRVSRLSVYNLLAAKKFPNAFNAAKSEGNGARYRIPQSDVDRFLDAQKVA